MLVDIDIDGVCVTNASVEGNILFGEENNFLAKLSSLVDN